jgi:hypothetical protein
MVFAAFFITNYVAHDSWRPPYTHRGDGPVLVQLDKSPGDRLTEDSTLLRDKLIAAGVNVSPETTVAASIREHHWVVWDPASQRRYALVDAGDEWELRVWDNWYEYEGSYWTPEAKQGVDRGEASPAVYAFHVLIGHRGIFSLTPLWILSVVGIVLWARSRDSTLRGFAALVIVLTLVVLAFYLLRPQVDRNYGGIACGFRWMFWFIPLWTLCLVPAADAIARVRMARIAAWTLLLISVMSAAYANLNPWSHSWLYDYWTYVHWISY